MARQQKGSWRRRAECVLVAVGVAALFGAGHSARAGGASTVRLTGDVVQNLNLATSLGPVPAAQSVTVGVFLQNPNQAAEDAYVKQLYDPSSANYRELPRPRHVQPAVRRAGRDAPGSAGVAPGSRPVGDDRRRRDELLARDGHRRAGRGRRSRRRSTATRSPVARFYANTVAPAVPASLGVGDVLGLNDFNRLLHAARRGDRNGRRPPPACRRPATCRTPACSARRTSGRSTTCRRRTTATASRWRSSAGASPTRWSPTSAASRPSGACRRCR